MIPRLSLRRATAADARMVFGWRNDPFIVERGSSRLEVGWEEHQAWFQRKLADPGCLLLIVEEEGRPIGQARFDRHDGECVISVYLLKDHIGRGRGVEAIRRGSVEAMRALGVRRVVACVREDNARGRKAFAKAGYVPTPTASCRAGHVALALTPDLHPDDIENIRLYSALAERHGLDVRAVDWGSSESQALRFKVLAGVGNLDEHSVLDVGCGLGDFLGWCRSNGVQPDYHGIDLTPKMIELAQARYPGGSFQVAGLFDVPLPHAGRSYDFVIASGIFAKRRSDPAAYLRQAAVHMYALCSTAVAFNALSTRAASADPGEFHADPRETLEYCRSLAPRASLREDYHPRDFTIYMHRAERP